MSYILTTALSCALLSSTEGLPWDLTSTICDCDAVPASSTLAPIGSPLVASRLLRNAVYWSGFGQVSLLPIALKTSERNGGWTNSREDEGALPRPSRPSPTFLYAPRDFAKPFPG